MATDLPDVNVWLAASVSGHPHHAAAQRWWRNEAADQIGFCRVTALALVRLLTQPAVMGGQPLAVAGAWRQYEALRRLREVVLLVEPEGVEILLAQWATSSDATPRLWTDAYLAAFARAGGYRIVTFDRDLDDFRGLDRLRLRP